MSKEIRSRILGIGSFLPDRVVTNRELSTMMDTSDEWIQQRTGIKERRWVETNYDLGTSELGLEASKRALQMAGLTAQDIGMIIFATLSPDHEFPGSACFLQAKLGIPGTAALDIRQQCSGFVYGLSIADQFIRTGAYKHILLVGGEIHSKGLDKTTRGRDVSVLFGDGAGAVVLGPTDDLSKHGILSTHLHADGKYAKELWVPAPGTAAVGDRMTEQRLENMDHAPQMNGKSVFMHASKRMPEVLAEALAANATKIEDVDLFVFHQANIRIIEMACKQMSIPESKVWNTLDRFGNTTAGSIPIGLDTAVQAGRLKPGMLVATAAFGSGFTWASALIRW